MRVFWVGLFLIFGCGPSEDLTKSKPTWAGEVLPRSYLAGFCLSEERVLPNFASFQEEQSFFQDFSSDFIGDSRIKGLSLISVMSEEDLLGDRGNRPHCAGSMIAQIDFVSGDEGASLLSQWQRAGRVGFWEPNWLNRISSENPTQLSLQYNAEGRRWWTDAIRLGSAIEEIKNFALSQDGEVHAPVIAVLDGGIDFAHPSLRGKIWQNTSNENTQCPGDRWGCNMVSPKGGDLGTGDAHPFGTETAGESCSEHSKRGRIGDCIHATHIAGIIAGNVQSGVPGVCPFCKVMNIRVLEEAEGEGQISDGAVLRGLKYLSQFEREPGKNLVRVVNLSFGKYQRGKALAFYIEHLTKVRDGILVIAAGGNEDSQRKIYPAAHPSVIAVAGLAASGRKASYSNYGSWINIAAPGGEIREGMEFAIESSIPGGGVAASQGTSMASPVVAGVAGLVLARNPDISFNDLRQTILDSADSRFYKEDFAGGYNFRNYFPRIDDENIPLLGVGMLDASAAVLGVKKTQSALKKKQRVQLNCASIAVSSEDRIDTRFLFFLVPLFFVMCLRWMERKKHYDSSD